MPANAPVSPVGTSRTYRADRAYRGCRASRAAAAAVRCVNPSKGLSTTTAAICNRRYWRALRCLSLPSGDGQRGRAPTDPRLTEARPDVQPFSRIAAPTLRARGSTTNERTHEEMQMQIQGHDLVPGPGTGRRAS